MVGIYTTSTALAKKYKLDKKFLVFDLEQNREFKFTDGEERRKEEFLRRGLATDYYDLKDNYLFRVGSYRFWAKIMPILRKGKDILIVSQGDMPVIEPRLFAAQQFSNFAGMGSSYQGELVASKKREIFAQKWLVGNQNIQLWSSKPMKI